jgi:hypothetical protein
MRWFVFSMEVASIVGAVALLVALVALALRRWTAAWKIARVSFWIGIGVFTVLGGLLGSRERAPGARAADASSFR